jgi:hypothetical protein
MREVDRYDEFDRRRPLTYPLKDRIPSFLDVSQSLIIRGK